ncbi:hypothetical protein Calab_0306 [Caldithrix abyssi DSM 13497]|uniref:Uncharacterized protein n=1 Tax=Caldithrix abyssi DSM 13497 TaxID=880073 RepID=H1XPN1_CALAY|nr:hypothetical protein [Caldithrix abyssi]APF19856.1 hypothetical protein Cabys_3108 [Caldithrix abyssi DSM 13497]EHO39952.1 hypothetical protein Calab_0306 [Caldithrix abyssi DSM 13497]
MQNNTGNGYEKSDANVNKIIAYTIMIMVLLGAIIVGVNEYFTYYSRQLEYDIILNKQSTELLELRAQEEQILNSYELLDYTKGIYRIPIERAMKILADEAYAKQKEEK